MPHYNQQKVTIKEMQQVTRRQGKSLVKYYALTTTYASERVTLALALQTVLQDLETQR